MVSAPPTLIHKLPYNSQLCGKDRGWTLLLLRGEQFFLCFRHKTSTDRICGIFQTLGRIHKAHFYKNKAKPPCSFTDCTYKKYFSLVFGESIFKCSNHYNTALPTNKRNWDLYTIAPFLMKILIYFAPPIHTTLHSSHL